MRRCHGDPEGMQHPVQNALVRCLVKADPDAVISDFPEVQIFLTRRSHDARLTHAHLDRDRVEERLGRDLGPCRAQRLGQPHGVEMHPFRNRAQADRPVKNRIESGHYGQKRLGRADIARRLLAPDMLLARLKAQPVCPPSRRIDRHAHDPPRHRPFIVVAARHERRVRSAIAQRHAEPLRRSDGDIRAHRARFLQHGQRQQVGRHHRNRPRAHAAPQFRA